jgi:hypothetical protein
MLMMRWDRYPLWSIFKRGIVGSFHKISAKYMPLYVAEFQFHYNNRFNDDSERRLRDVDARDIDRIGPSTFTQ